MSNILAAQQAKASQALSKKIRRSNGQVMTIADYLQALKNEGLTPGIGQKNKIQYNRIKYNRMSNHREQEEYMSKCNELVTEYRAMDPAPLTSWIPITKTEYDYFCSLFTENETGPEYATEEQLKHLFKLETVK